MDIRHALLTEIAANPADDSSWAVFSDWFEDQQEPLQAELVRLSLWLRRHEGGPDRPGHEQRFRELLAVGLQLPLPRQRLAVGKDAEMELTFVPPGQFLMGSPAGEARRDEDEGPVHAVSLSRGLWIGTHLVTQGQWRSLLGGRLPGRFRGRLLPVEGVNWFECQEFLETLSRQHGKPFRLPTEAEWEYACRSLTSTPFFFGPSLASSQANFDGNYPFGNGAVGPWLEAPTPVGAYAPNAFGLFDMHGNVWEWCSDWFDTDYYRHSPAVDPQGPATGALRVFRGGSWYSYGWSCRSANREKFAPESGVGNFGFRAGLGG